jgi:hypothetical protein
MCARQGNKDGYYTGIPDAAPAVFAGIETTHGRLVKLVETLDDFYGRGSLRLRLASRDRELVPPLHGFLSAVEAGVEALVRAALATSGEPERAVRVAITLTSFPVWLEFERLGLPKSELAELKLKLLQCGLAAARQA